MAALVDPSGDFLFESVADIADEHGVTHKVPRTPQEWAAVRHHLQVLRDAPQLLIVPGRRAAATQEHRELFEAIRRSDSETAESVMSAHLEHLGQSMAKLVDGRGKARKNGASTASIDGRVPSRVSRVKARHQ